MAQLVKRLTSAQIMISGSWDQARHQAPASPGAPASPSAPLPAHAHVRALSLSLSFSVAVLYLK